MLSELIILLMKNKMLLHEFRLYSSVSCNDIVSPLIVVCQLFAMTNEVVSSLYVKQVYPFMLNLYIMMGVM